jgi:diguanylate cyclase (GGDEF)-like protein
VSQPDATESTSTAQNTPELTPAPAALLRRLAQSPAALWKNKVGWRIAMTLFGMMMVLQLLALVLILKIFGAQGTTPLRVSELLSSYFYHILGCIALMATLITGILMVSLSRWLLEPITLLQRNLLNAARNPEKPELRLPKKDTRDEIGIALRIAIDLIRQNAHNLKRLRASAEDKIHKLAYYDVLTGLPNRSFFLEKLEDVIKHKVLEEERRVAVFCVDIDHFKDINDTMGHEMGDSLLEIVGKRLVKALPKDCVISRASADEFSIMTVLSPEVADSAALVDRIFSAMSAPVTLGKESFQVHVSVGISHCPEDGTEARQIIKNADIALNRAKEEGRDTARHYSQDLDQAVQKRFQMLRDLRVALDQKQLQLYYHPQFDLKTGAVIGAEALLRWFRPDNSKTGGAFVPPLDFIPVAEESGLIVPIGEWVLRTACQQNKAWQNEGILPPFRVGVNISSVQFHRSDLAATVESVLQETSLDAKYLELEVTESIFMENMEVAIETLNRLHRQGVELAVDDFGTGYSSLNYLRRFPIDRLKIDQSFIRSALVNPEDRTITRTIISLGHSLNLKVIAEGVETQEHEDFLKAEGCDEAQGFKYSKPIPADQLKEFIITHNRNLAKNSKLSVVEDAPAAG